MKNFYDNATTPLLGGAGSWQREARRVLLLAAELGVTLSGNDLLYDDVRDLMARRDRLQRQLARLSRDTFCS